jgi:hypothetical protein
MDAILYVDRTGRRYLIGFPLGEVAVDGLVGWEVVGEASPGLHMGGVQNLRQG